MIRTAFLVLPLFFAAVARGADVPLDVKQSSLKFTGHATLHDFHGQAQDFHGSAQVDAADPNLVRSAVIDLAPAHLTTFQATRDKNMREWLHIDAHSQIEFRLTKVQHTSDPNYPSHNASNWFAVSGDFTLNGVTRPITAKATGWREGSRLIVDGTTTLDTTQFGLPIISQFFLTVDRNVDVSFHLVFDLPPR
jgi:polyisoprenoid-binding protein YceI